MTTNNNKPDVPEQRSLDWFRARLGKITGSQVGVLMGRPRYGNAMFTDTAMGYIYSVAAERDVNKAIVNDDDAFQQWLDQMETTSKSIRWGVEQEDYARDIYGSTLQSDYTVKTTGSIAHPKLDCFASSPDGLVCFSYGAGLVVGTIEIKSPQPKTFMQYRQLIHTASDLKRINSVYYWQCVSHMAVTDALWCDFVVYCPWLNTPIHKVRIERNKDEICALEERVSEANKLITSMLSPIR